MTLNFKQFVKFLAHSYPSGAQRESIRWQHTINETWHHSVSPKNFYWFASGTPVKLSYLLVVHLSTTTQTYGHYVNFLTSFFTQKARQLKGDEKGKPGTFRRGARECTWTRGVRSFWCLLKSRAVAKLIFLNIVCLFMWLLGASPVQ